MTNKMKNILLPAGLMVCVIILRFAFVEAEQPETGTPAKITSPSAIQQIHVGTKTRSITQTTSKLLKPIQ